MRQESTVIKARELRNLGWSCQAIASELGVGNKTVSVWCREIKNKRSQSILNHYKKRRMKFLKQDRIEIEIISKYKARLYAALLYWCEGSKYPSTGSVCFTSSDPLMQQLFVSLLRKGFSINENKLKIWLQLHTDQEREKIYTFWSKLLKIPTSQFMNPKLTQKQGRQYRRIYYGTCSIRYDDYSILLRLTGIYTRFCRNVLSNLT